MSDFIIKAEGLSKKYMITGETKEPYKSLRDVVASKAKSVLKGRYSKRSDKQEFWALNDINFEIKQGEAVAIIGRNGAGKSTLLKVLSRITEPSVGRIEINGRIASLLEVGTGFHPELTGRENIYLNGAILGMSRVEIKRKFDEIVDFSGVAKFLNTPVKRYSSGMYVRLAFSVAAHLEPEILVVDEVLAVGDAEFQKKCLGKMEEVSQSAGRTILFVSHNMTAVRSLCTRGILLDKGGVIHNGSVSEAISIYQNNNLNNNHWRGEDGSAMLIIRETQVFNDGNNFANTSAIHVKLIVELKEDYSDLVIGFTIQSIFGNPVATAIYNDYNDHAFLKAGVYELLFTIPPSSLAAGEYELLFNVSIPFVKKISSEKINLAFRVYAEGETGNKFFVENDPTFNSIVRPNWFTGLSKIN